VREEFAEHTSSSSHSVGRVREFDWDLFRSPLTFTVCSKDDTAQEGIRSAQPSLLSKVSERQIGKAISR
jgi:hypothetical protein